MARRTKFEAGYDEDDYVKRCMKCKHRYTNKNEIDTLFCSLEECRFEPEYREVGGEIYARN